MAEAGNERNLTKGEKTKYRLARAMKECMKSTSVENIPVKQIVYEAQVKKFIYIQEEQTVFAAAFRYDEQNSLRQHDFDLILDFYEKLICEKTGKVPDENLRFLLEMYCHSSIYMTVRWVTGELTCTPEGLAAALVDGMPGRLAEVFTGLGILN